MLKRTLLALAAAVERECSLAQPGRFYSGDADVDRFGLEMQAVFCHSDAMGAKVMVAPGSTVATDDINFCTRMSHGRFKGRQEIVQVRIEVANVASAMVPQEMVELRKRVGKIRVPPAVHDVDSLVRVRLKQPQSICALRRVRKRRRPGRCAQDSAEKNDAAAEARHPEI